MCRNVEYITRITFSSQNMNFYFYFQKFSLTQITIFLHLVCVFGWSEIKDFCLYLLRGESTLRLFNLTYYFFLLSFIYHYQASWILLILQLEIFRKLDNGSNNLFSILIISVLSRSYSFLLHIMIFFYLFIFVFLSHYSVYSWWYVLLIVIIFCFISYIICKSEHVFFFSISIYSNLSALYHLIYCLF